MQESFINLRNNSDQSGEESANPLILKNLPKAASDDSMIACKRSKYKFVITQK